MTSMTRISLIAAAAALVSAASFAQTGQNYDVQTMNFDMWCQEQAHLAPERCDKRTAEDEKTFEDYRAKIEQYEIPYLQQKQKELSVHRDIMQNDPVDNPVSQNPDAQAQDPNRQAPAPQP
jgi:maltooligosyltrehalose synthase